MKREKAKSIDMDKSSSEENKNKNGDEWLKKFMGIISKEKEEKVENYCD